MAANQTDLRSNDTPKSLQIVDFKSHIDPATTTNIEVNINKKSTTDDVESSIESIPRNTKINTSNSHNRLSDLAHKVTDLLFSTKRSIDLNSSSVSSSPCNSPVTSRGGSTVSLNRLTVNHRPSVSSRRGVYNNNHSPNRDNNNNGVNNKDIFRQGSHTSLSERFLHSTSNQLPCHFGCAVPNANNNTSNNHNNNNNNNNNTNNNNNNSNNNNNNAKVKETHYVHVEYDPITRKRVLNTYEILKDLGSGQHGKVKLAKDLATDQLVAIKIVDRATKANLGRLTRKGTSQEDKIRKEIAIMKKCSHPHVVKLIEVLDAENSRKIYMVLEYLEKGELEWQRKNEKTNDKPEPLLTLEQTKNIFRDIVSGLEYLHHQGVIHRDIKPSNLLVSKDNVVKISDFGVSFAANLDGNDEFELAKTAGTPAFLAPELCKTDGSDVKVTYKIDIWALGVTLYCLLFGRLPFFADTEFQLFDSINNDELKFPNMEDWKVVKQLSDYDFNQSKDILTKLLKKNPEERIEIDEIKQHPFFLEGLSKIQSKEYGSNWDNKMKIDVSNQEVDEAVMGLGNRIRKRLSDAFKRTIGSSSSTVNGSSYSPNSTSLQPSGLSSLSLRDDCSYIFSESRNKNGSQISLSAPMGHGLSSTALLKESIKHADTSSNSDSPAYSDIGKEQKIPNLSNYETKEESTKCFSLSNIVEKQKNMNLVVEVDVETETETETEPEPEPEIEPEPKLEPELGPELGPELEPEPESEPMLETNSLYDYRKELEEAEKYKAVELTVNPSYASLDSYYDEAYSNFLNPRSPISPNLASAPVGSFSGRQANNNLMFMRAGGNPNAGQSAILRKSSPTGMDKDNFNNSNGSRKPQSTTAAHNLKKLRGIKTNSLNVNQQQRSPSAFFSNDSSDGEDGPITFNKKPVNSRNITSSNRRKSSSAHRRDHPRAVFTQDSDCSSEENDDPIVIEKKFYSPANAEAINKQLEDEKFVAMKNTSSQENLVCSEDIPRQSIYGTKIPLLSSLDPSEEENDSSNSDNDELMLSFSRRVPISVTSHHLKHTEIAAPATETITNANQSMCSVTESEIVDVPSNILQAEENKTRPIAGLSDEFNVLSMYDNGSKN